jgi:hypothetical protein
MTEPSLLKQLRKNVRDTVLQVPDIERKVKNAYDQIGERECVDVDVVWCV